MLIKQNIIIVHSDDKSMCGQLRMHCMTQLGAAGRTGDFQFVVSPEEIQDEYILTHTYAVVTNKVMTERDASMVCSYGRKKKKFGYRIVVDYDDVVWDVFGESLVPEYNTGVAFDAVQVGKNIDSCLRYVDEVTLSTRYLATKWLQRFDSKHLKLSVVPNYLPRAWYGSRKRRVDADVVRPRIVYGGSPTHYSSDDRGDFAGPWIPWLIDAVSDGKAELHMFGKREDTHPMFYDIYDLINWHAPTSAWEWGSTLRDINGDIYIAPLAENQFNSCKSNIKLLEACACGMAFMGSSWSAAEPYWEAHPLSFVSNHWSEAQLMHRFEEVCRQDNFNSILEHQEKMIDKYWLENDKNIGDILKTWCRGGVRIS